MKTWLFFATLMVTASQAHGALILLTASAWAQPAPRPWNLLVTHEPPTQAQREILAIQDRAEVQQKALP